MYICIYIYIYTHCALFVSLYSKILFQINLYRFPGAYSGLKIYIYTHTHTPLFATKNRIQERSEERRKQSTQVKYYKIVSKSLFPSIINSSCLLVN